DKHGKVLYLNERECSIQRRNQKVIEEAPSPFLDTQTRARMGAESVALAQAVNYCSAGTVEFIVDSERNFYFLEMNTRLQVEHPVTELITGVDLVEQMIRVAAGEKLALEQADVKIDGWAMESRLYAEDPYRGFLPSIGRLTRYRPPVEGVRADGSKVRNDTGVEEGSEISMFYDPMIAKLCSWGADRMAAIETMRGALDAFEVEGIGHNLPFCAAVMDHPRFVSGEISTAFIEEEYPDGFEGAKLSGDALGNVAVAALCMKHLQERRATRIEGATSTFRRKLAADWVVSIGEWSREMAIAVEGGDQGAVVTLDGQRFDVSALDWRPGASLATVEIRNGDVARQLTLKVAPRTEGFRIRYRGADLDVKVRTRRSHELALLMPVKLPPDTSKLLLCPMPGLIVRVDVGVGDEVQEGQVLAVVEAMKMENILRAEKRAVVSAVKAAPGDSLAVDEVILEFE
ncbi:MAG: acetyl/propionyl-CoA carboxylase subunit alpha, partial [Rhodobacteraceae bacterium]|nr:acetyl/propionyl-CoA carboxylase subunit alpha [Paracoccaceae bacterium]